MAYDSQFQLLTPKVVRLLSAEYNSEVRSMYIDCLALLQGLLGRFSSDHAVSVFDEPQSVDRMIEERLSLISSLISVLSSADAVVASRSEWEAQARLLRDSLIDIVRANKETAVDLFAECTSPRSSIPQQAVFKLVDDYLNALVTQYRFLRYPNTQPQTLEAGR